MDHIACDGDQVGIQAIYFFDYGLQVIALDGWANMNIADLHDSEAMQAIGQLSDGDINMHHACSCPGIDEAD